MPCYLCRLRSHAGHTRLIYQLSSRLVEIDPRSLPEYVNFVPYCCCWVQYRAFWVSEKWHLYIDCWTTSIFSTSWTCLHTQPIPFWYRGWWALLIWGWNIHRLRKNWPAKTSPQKELAQNIWGLGYCLARYRFIALLMCKFLLAGTISPLKAIFTHEEALYHDNTGRNSMAFYRDKDTVRFITICPQRTLDWTL